MKYKTNIEAPNLFKSIDTNKVDLFVFFYKFC